MKKRFRVTFSFEVNIDSGAVDDMHSGRDEEDSVLIQDRLLRVVLQDEAFVQALMKRLIVEDLARFSENAFAELLHVDNEPRRKYRQLLPFIKKLSRQDQAFFHLAVSDAVFEERISYFLSRFSSELVAAKLLEVEEPG